MEQGMETGKQCSREPKERNSQRPDKVETEVTSTRLGWKALNDSVSSVKDCRGTVGGEKREKTRN